MPLCPGTPGIDGRYTSVVVPKRAKCAAMSSRVAVCGIFVMKSLSAEGSTSCPWAAICKAATQQASAPDTGRSPLCCLASPGRGPPAIPCAGPPGKAASGAPGACAA
mmetsp:Transcript_55579/g.178308  ORF Transcript_55579/g.178308 Transcript_55579/m.178308 type:complete len:107 (+) Transcript_55579:1096-1416(+)